jgi:adenine deaminase
MATLDKQSDSRRRLVDVALGRDTADLVLRGGQVVITPTGEVLTADVAVVDGLIVTVGDCAAMIGESTQVQDLSGRYVMPGFIDGHLHPENSRLSPAAIADVLVTAGTTSIVTGFDHIAAAAGIDGVRAALDETSDSDLSVFWASPFRLPYTTPASTLGHPWTEREHREAMAWPECIGVWELCPGFVEIHDEITWAGIDQARLRNLGVFGSVPCSGHDLGAVAAHVGAGLHVDHEAYDVAELRAKLRLGLHALIRDSPVENFLPRLIGVVLEHPELAHLIGLCTDEFVLAEVRAHGHIGRLVREAVRLGVPPVTAIQMATLNTARAYRVDDRVGSLTPGRRADIVVCDDLTEFIPRLVFAGGRLVARDGVRAVAPTPSDARAATPTPFPCPEVTAARLVIQADAEAVDATVIGLTDNAFHRLKLSARIPTADGVVAPDPDQDICVLAYVNRFGNGPTKPGLGLVSGFGLTSGALATSSTPDDENILCVGTNAADMALAINTLIRAGGGDIVVADGDVRHLFALPVHGIMSDRPADEVMAQESATAIAARDIGCAVPHPFMFLGILAVTGIPEIGMSDRGPVDFATRSVIPAIDTDKGHKPHQGSPTHKEKVR